MFKSGFPSPHKDRINGSNIKSIQRGVITLNATSITTTIAAVDLTKSVLRFTQVSSNTTNDLNNCDIQGIITNSTTLTFSIYTLSGSVTISWEVIEFNNVKTLQSGVYALSTTSGTLTISNVNVQKSVLFYSHKTNTNTSAAWAVGNLEWEFTNSTTITFKSAFATTFSISWILVEFD